MKKQDVDWMYDISDNGNLEKYSLSMFDKKN